MLYRFKNNSTQSSLEETIQKQNEITDFISGSDEAFSSIYTKYADGIRKFVHSRISDLETVEELTQEIFLKVFRFRDAYDGTHAFSTWLWTIAKNSTFDHLRSVKLKNLSHQDGETSPVEQIPCLRDGAESLLVRKDQRRALFQLLKNLTRMQRRVVWFRMIRHLSYDEIAKKLGVSTSAVRNAIFRAKATLGNEILAG
jgi:RNA polymerase sigma-70 factor (ECF subfamily)